MTKRDELLLDVVRKLDIQGVASWAIDKLSDHIESNPPAIPDSSPVECECDPAPHWHNAHGELRFHAVPAPVADHASTCERVTHPNSRHSCDCKPATVAGEVCGHRFCNPGLCYIRERDEPAAVAENSTAGEPRLAPCKHFLYMKCKHDGCQPQPTTPVQVEPGPPRKDNP